MTHYEVRVDCRVPPDGSGGIDVLELCSRCVRYVLPPPPRCVLPDVPVCIVILMA